MLDLNSRKVIIHNMTIRGIEKVPGILDFDQRGIIDAKDNDLVITRRIPEKLFLDYLTNLGWDFHKIIFISPRSLDNFKYNSIFYKDEISDSLKDKKGLYLDCYQVTEEEEKFSQKIKIPFFATPKIAIKYGTKSGFRMLCKTLKLNVPYGYEDIKSVNAAHMLIVQLFNEHKDIKAIVVKLDEGISAAGNTKIEASFLKNTLNRQKEVVKQALLRVPQDKNNGASIEVWIEDIIASPSIQLLVLPSGKIEILSLHDQLLEGEEKWYVGCIYPPHSTNNKVINKIKKDALIFTRYLAKEGFYGYLGLDTVVDKDNRIWWMEANMRKPATFYPRIIAEKLNDGSLNDIYYIASDFTVTRFKGVNFITILNYFKEYLYPMQGEKRGIVLYNVGALKEAGRFDLVCFGKDSEDTFSIYTAIKNKMKKVS